MLSYFWPVTYKISMPCEISNCHLIYDFIYSWYICIKYVHWPLLTVTWRSLWLLINWHNHLSRLAADVLNKQSLATNEHFFQLLRSIKCQTVGLRIINWKGCRQERCWSEGLRKSTKFFRITCLQDENRTRDVSTTDSFNIAMIG
jgi:hypothetical protein